MQSSISPALAPAPMRPVKTAILLHNRIGLAILMGVLVTVLFGVRIGSAGFKKLRFF